MILKMFLIFVILYMMPYIVGRGIIRFLKLDAGITGNYLLGNVFIWALFQIITVPLVLSKSSFLVVVYAVNVLLLTIILLTLYDEVVRCKCEHLKLKHYKNRLKKTPLQDIIAVCIFLVILAWLLYKIISLQHTDADDARFVVNAADILRTNRMFLTDPSTGLEVSKWFGEIVKDITSPWAVYIAYLSKMTGVSVVIMAHSVMPIMLILNVVSVYWQIAEEIFSKSSEESSTVNKGLMSKSMFMCVALMTNVYGYVSIYAGETFMLTRIWQGKAVVASVAIPTMFLFFIWLYKDYKNIRLYFLILLANLSMCLMSGMGIIIGLIMITCVGLVYGVVNKKIYISATLWLMCIPNAMYYLISILEKKL